MIAIFFVFHYHTICLPAHSGRVTSLIHFLAASDDEIKEFWKVMLDIDASLESCAYTKKTIKSKDANLNIISHCCHYSFTVKKCFVEFCGICSPFRLPPEVYHNLHHLPDPVLSNSEKGHYNSFDEVYGTQTSKQDQPSAKKAKEVGSHCFTVRCVKYANLMLQCEEFELVYIVRENPLKVKQVLI